MALPIYDEFVKQYPHEIRLKFSSNEASDSNCTKIMEDFSNATQKLFNKYPDLKQKLSSRIYGSLPQYSGSYKITTRIELLVRGLEAAERYAISEREAREADEYYRLHAHEAWDNNTLINGPLIQVKKSNFNNRKNKNLLTMPSRENELKGLFGGKRKTMCKGRSNKKSRKSRKNK